MRPRLKSYVSNPIPLPEKSHHNKPHHKSHHSHQNLHHRGETPQRSLSKQPFSKQTLPIQFQQNNSHTNNPHPNTTRIDIPFSLTLPPLSLFPGCSSDHNQKIVRPPKKDSKAHHRAKSVTADEPCECGFVLYRGRRTPFRFLAP